MQLGETGFGENLEGQNEAWPGGWADAGGGDGGRGRDGAVLRAAGRGNGAPRRLPHEPPAAAQAQGTQLVDINSAGLEELMSLPGIGQVRAQAILDDREENGPYRYPEELVRVKGIGEGILENILDQITTGGYADAQNTGG